MAAVGVAVALFSACSSDVDLGQTLDSDEVVRGGELYQHNCASCHRADLSVVHHRDVSGGSSEGGESEPCEHWGDVPDGP
jgi:mono/diheme cytochrome c family protein